MGSTKIEWCEKVWNPVTGCSPVSGGCRNCYARRMAYRLKGRYGYPKDDPFKVTFHPERLEEPLHWKKPSRIFVCSMGDLFHEHTGIEWFEDILSIIKRCPNHTFLFLTKRPDGLRESLENIDERFFHWPYKNLWLGVSVEDQKTADERIPILLQIPAAKRFVSVEPMLGPIDFSHVTMALIGLNWVICGGETGPNARPLHPDWVRSLRDQCQAAGVPLFFKSWGEYRYWPDLQKEGYLTVDQNPRVGFHHIGHKKSGRLLDGQEWDEIP